MMANTKPMRVDPEFEKEMRMLAKQRYMKNLAMREPSSAEMTRLLRKTLGWKNSKFELQTKPKRESLG